MKLFNIYLQNIDANKYFINIKGSDNEIKINDFKFSEGPASTLTDILELNSTDADSKENGQIRYSIVNQQPGFFLGATDGILRANLTNVSKTIGDILLTVKATDMGTPPLFTVVPVRIKINTGSGVGPKSLNKMDYK